MNEPDLKPILADLKWVYNAPALMRFQNSWHPRERLDCDLSSLPKERLEHLLTLRQGKLGRYFEQLACALIEASPGYSIVATGQIIQGASRTLGELDLIVRNEHTDQVLHLELALKFYLKAIDTSPEDSSWIGPGRKDFLKLKHQHLKNQQLKLPETARQEQAWPEHLPFPDLSLPWVTGRAFYPWGARLLPTPALAEGHLSGFWLTLSEFEHLNFQGYWIKKANWLAAPLMPAEAPTTGLPAQYFGHPVDNMQSRHWFIVPDDWPERAQISMLQRFQPPEDADHASAGEASAAENTRTGPALSGDSQ